MTSRWPILGVAGLLLLTSPAVGQSLYVGGGVGGAFFSSEFEDALDQIRAIDENAVAWKLFGGFSPLRFLGIEGGYRHFGTVKATVTGLDVEAGTKGWDVEGLGRLRIAIFDLFGKAGAMFWSNDITVNASPVSDTSGTDFLWGLGAGVHLGPLGLRAEWERVETGDPLSLSMVSLSATIGF
jgi:hypothetical protein